VFNAQLGGAFQGNAEEVRSNSTSAPAKVARKAVTGVAADASLATTCLSSATGKPLNLVCRFQ
jgi:hypothetical protein